MLDAAAIAARSRAMRAALAPVADTELALTLDAARAALSPAYAAELDARRAFERDGFGSAGGYARRFGSSRAPHSCGNFDCGSFVAGPEATCPKCGRSGGHVETGRTVTDRQRRLRRERAAARRRNALRD